MIAEWSHDSESIYHSLLQVHVIRSHATIHSREMYVRLGNEVAATALLCGCRVGSRANEKRWGDCSVGAMQYDDATSVIWSESVQ